MKIQDYVKPKHVEGKEPGAPFIGPRMSDLGLSHPATDYAKVTGQATLASALVSMALTTIFVFLGWSGPALIVAAFFIIMAYIQISAWRDRIQAQLIRPHVFIGWPYDTANDSPLLKNVLVLDDVSNFLLLASAFLWPTWCVLSILPPTPRSLSSKWREDTEARGSQWPFIFRTVVSDSTQSTLSDGEAWRNAVSGAIAQCSLAIFDCRRPIFESLEWECHTATETLGASKVCYLKSGKDDVLELWVNGRKLDPSPLSKSVAPTASQDKHLWNICIRLREWVAEELPVYAVDLESRKQFARLDRAVSISVMPVYGIALLIFLFGIAISTLQIF